MAPPRVCVWCGYKCSAMACKSCLRQREVNSVVVVAAYREAAKALVHSAKFNHNRLAAEAIGLQLATYAMGLSVELVTTVPTLPAHIRSRGYDHAEAIGKSTAMLIKRPYKRLLRRLKTTTQVGKNRQERLNQAANSVNLIKPFKPKSVLLIDDVVTTGATIADCVAALNWDGNKNVHVIAFAFQPSDPA